MDGEPIESCWTTKGFNDRFDQILQENSGNSNFRYTHAYEQAENEHVNKFGKLKFKNYDSFRSARRNLLFGTNG